MSKIAINPGLYERAKSAAAKAGYSSVQEFIEHAIENELKRQGEELADKLVTDRLRGLGYIE